MQQTVDMLHKKLEQLGSVKHGSFCVDCETYHATGNVGGNIELATFSIITGETHFQLLFLRLVGIIELRSC